MRIRTSKLALFITLAQLASSIGTSSALGQDALPQAPPVRFSVDHSDHVYYEGDTLRISIESDIDAYVYVFYHQKDGTAVMLYPNFAAKDNRITAGTRTDPLGDRVVITAPFGMESLQMLSAEQPIADFDRWVDESGGGVPQVPSEYLASWCEQNGPEALIAADQVEIETRAVDSERVRDGN